MVVVHNLYPTNGSVDVNGNRRNENKKCDDSSGGNQKKSDGRYRMHRYQNLNDEFEQRSTREKKFRAETLQCISSQQPPPTF